MQGWELTNKTAQTYFTSQFYDFNNGNENSKIEDFDISQEYLKSELSQKSIILKQINQSNFLKTLQIYARFCLYSSLYQWRKINQNYKIQQRKSPQNMTKLFIKVFYTLNKKIRTKIQKSFVKIHNFTKNYDMKTYEIPIVVGIKKLDLTFKSMNQKYFYNHPINSQQLLHYAFKQITLRLKVLKNKNQIQRMLLLLNKMTSSVSLKQFHQFIASCQRVLQKLQIFVGSLNLIIKPIKRNVLQGIKKYTFQLPKQNSNWFVQNVQNIYNHNCNRFQNDTFERILDDEIDEEQFVEDKEKTFRLNEKKENNHNEQNDEEKTPKKSLSFSKDFRRKGSNQKNKLKFKRVHGNSPQARKNKQQSHKNKIQHNKYSVIKDLSTQNKKQQISKQTNIKTIVPLNLSSTIKSLKLAKIGLKIQNSLGFQSKSIRNLSVNQKLTALKPLKPHQLGSSFPDYFDISSYSHLPLAIEIPTKKYQKAEVYHQQLKKPSVQGFKTIKSGKSVSFLQNQSQKTDPHLIQNSSVKFPFKSISFKTLNNLQKGKSHPQIESPLSELYRVRSAQKQLIHENRNEKQLQFSSNQKHKINNPSKINKADFNSQFSIKHHYLFPISKEKNIQSAVISKGPSKNKRENQHVFTEYQSYPLNQEQPFKKSISSSKQSLQNGKSTLLSFNTNRPMKKVKSGSKDSIKKILSPQNKKQKEKEKNSKSKKVKQIKTQYYDSKNQTSYAQSEKNKLDKQFMVNAKYLKGNSLQRPSIKSISTKSYKKQK